METSTANGSAGEGTDPESFQEPHQKWPQTATDKGWQVVSPHVSGSQNDRLLDIRLKIGRKDVALVFNPIVNRIVGLVKHQIDRTRARTGRFPKVSLLSLSYRFRSTDEQQAVLLVGGLGQNPYLAKRLRDSVEALGIEVRKPTMAQA